MTIQYYFAQMNDAHQRIDGDLTQIQTLWSEPVRVRPSRLRSLRSDVRLEVDELIRLQGETAARIAQMQDSQMRQLLALRYMRGLRWKDIAERMHYSSRHLQRLHIRALEQFEDVDERFM